jgi:hypothetical protein
MYDFSGPLVNMSPKGAHGGKTDILLIVAMTILLLDVMLKFGSALLYYLAFYYLFHWGVKLFPLV